MRMIFTSKSYVDNQTTVAGTGLSRSGNVMSVNTVQTHITKVGILDGLTASGKISFLGQLDSSDATSAKVSDHSDYNTGAIKTSGGVVAAGASKFRDISFDRFCYEKHDYHEPFNGQTIAIGSSCTILNPPATVASVNILFPTSPSNGLVVKITSSQHITTVNVTNATFAQNSQLTSITGGVPLKFVYSSINNRWFRTI